MAVSTGDVVIVGAGIIGLAAAFELAGRGAAVRVYDSGEPAKAASWAAAGMLAPLTERVADEPTRRLCESSLELYPEFVQSVRNAGGIDAHLSLHGILSAAFSDDAMNALIRRAEDLNAARREVAVLDRPQTLTLEPALGKHTAGALFVRDEGWVDNRRLGRGLAAACEARGVRLYTGIRSLSVECDGRRVLGVRSDSGYVAAGAVVNAAGAWAAQVRGIPQPFVAPVRPVKGQMLAMQIPAGFVRHAIWLPGAYVVPRADGRLLVGATVEDAGFDTRITAGGLDALLHAVVGAAPALRDFAITETWAGLRPCSQDGRPFVGATALAGYYLAAGHCRNGILLAPATARLLADEIENGAQAGLAPFRLERSGTKLAADSERATW